MERENAELKVNVCSAALLHMISIVSEFFKVIENQNIAVYYQASQLKS